jgi:hypothetical protein
MQAFASLKSILGSHLVCVMLLTVEIVTVRSGGIHSVAKFTRKINAIIKVIIKLLSKLEFQYTK